MPQTMLAEREFQRYREKIRREPVAAIVNGGVMRKTMVGLIALLLVSAPVHADVPSRLSAAVAFEKDGALNRFWLEHPGYGYVEAHFRIPTDLADDVVFGVDQEWMDGIVDPYFGTPGGDWMAFVGVQRTGAVWVAAGTPETMDGIPSTERDWRILDLGASIVPNHWYKIRVLADFSQRRYASVTVVGPNVDTTIDLSEYSLDYPNKAEFDGRAMTYYVWSLRSESLADDPEQSATVFFDDVSGGYLYGAREYTAMADDFEGAPIALPALPFDFIYGHPIRLDQVQDATWYLERDEALVMSVDDQGTGFARSGRRFLVCDATLHQTVYDWWVFLGTLIWDWVFSWGE